MFDETLDPDDAKWESCLFISAVIRPLFVEGSDGRLLEKVCLLGADIVKRLWSLLVRRISWPQELIDKYPFLGSISMPNHTNKADLLEWRDDNGNVQPFSVSMVWNSIRPGSDKVIWSDVVWFSLCISRHAFNLWLIIKQRLKTQDKICSWDISSSLSMLCPLCDLKPDSHEHLFFECSFSQQVWNYMKTYAGMSTSVPVFSSTLASLIPIAKRKSSKSVIAKMVVAACAYYIWQERNWRLFKKNKRTAKQVIDCIMSCVRLKLLSCKFKKSNDGVLFSRLWNLPDSVFI
ncbi:hypothetical protein Tco_0292051 [Tanacetum coccineum]